MTDHVYIHTVIPTGVDSCVFQCMMLTPEEPATERAERHYQKNYDVVRVVFDEDFAIGEGIHKASLPGRTSTSPSADTSVGSTSASAPSTPHWPAN
jgi:hypothetical protein